jgi:hypothetical protein
MFRPSGSASDLVLSATNSLFLRDRCRERLEEVSGQWVMQMTKAGDIPPPPSSRSIV